MCLQLKKDFNELAKKFETNKFDLKTVSQLIELVRLYKQELSANSARILLEVPLNVIKYDVELKDKETWVNSNREYFSNNIIVEDKDFKKKWRQKFSNDDYDTQDIFELAKIVSEDFEKYRYSCEYLLRLIEVTIRDDVNLFDDSNFYKSGKIFSSHIIKAIEV